MASMRWSKLRSELKDRLAADLRDRIAIHQARYRQTREEDGRIWVELDGRELISFDTVKYIARRAQLGHEIRAARGNRTPGEAAAAEGYFDADEAAKDSLRRSGEYDDYSAIDDLESYLSLSIDDALISPSPLLRGLALADRRVGKRRLRSMKMADSEHPFVREMYNARCDVEDIRENR